MRKLIPVILFIFSLHLASAQGVSVSYQISPALLLPGDYAECTMVITNPTSKDVVVSSVTLSGYGVEVAPNGIFSIGKLPPGGSVSLSFSIKAIKVGIYNVVASISTQNGTLRQNIQVVVDDSFPSVTITSPLHKGEVNTLTFYISSPVELKAVRVEPLFNATPQSVYLGDVGSQGAEGTFKLLPTSSTLKFRVSFYNGNNFHQVIRSVDVRMLEARQVAINATLVYRTLYLGDVVDLPVEVANLRGDDILDVKVSVSGLGFNDSREIPKIPSGESKRIVFKFSPSKSGKGEITITTHYSDEFGNEYDQTKRITVKALDSLAVSVTNLNIAREGAETRVSGDVSNNGRSIAYNVYSVLTCNGYRADYFVGNIDPSDFQSFDLPAKCNGSATLAVSWSNEIGETFEIQKEVRIGSVLQHVEAGEFPVVVSIAAALVVLAIIGVIVYRYIRK